MLRFGPPADVIAPPTALPSLLVGDAVARNLVEPQACIVSLRSVLYPAPCGEKGVAHDVDGVVVRTAPHRVPPDLVVVRAEHFVEARFVHDRNLSTFHVQSLMSGTERDLSPPLAVVARC